MTQSLRLLCVLAHPDDESLGTGGTLARYGAEGVETYLLTATRGQRGWFGDPADNPGPEALGKIREAELRKATRILGVRHLTMLDYCDGELRQANVEEVLSHIVAHIRRIRPHVVITFGPDGAYGHPDHIAISQMTTTAVTCAADPIYCRTTGLKPHLVSKFYYRIWTRQELDIYSDAFGDIAIEVDGEMRYAFAWPDWAVTTWLDTADHWRTVWRAVECHQTQLPGYQALKDLPDERQKQLWGAQSYYRAMNAVNCDPGIETDLFAGIR